MKAAVLVGCEKIEIKDIPVPDTKGSDVLIEVKTCGICCTDPCLSWRVESGFPIGPGP